MTEFGETALAAILLAAAAGKAKTGLASFASFLERVGLRRQPLALAAAICTVEAAVGAWLLVGLARVAALGAALALGSAFVAVQLRTARSDRSGCHCFGLLDEAAGSRLLGPLRALLFLTIAAVTTTGVAIGSAPADRSIATSALGMLAGCGFIVVFALLDNATAVMRRGVEEATA